MALTVEYNGLTMCDACDISTPFVSRSTTYQHVGERSFRVTNLTLTGQIYATQAEIDAGDHFDAIDDKRNLILDAYSEDFKTLVAGNYTFNYIIVKEVSFSEGNIGIVDFTITLESHDHFFQDTGVVDPKNEYTFTEQEDGVLTLRHSISAKGMRSYHEAIDRDSDGDVNETDPVARARAWCEGYTGLPEDNGWTSIKNFSTTGQDYWGRHGELFTAAGTKADFEFSGNPFSISHTVDRFTGVYSIEETWKQGKYSEAGYVESYDVSEKYSVEDEHTTIQINYSIKGPPGTTIATVRGKVPSITQFHYKIKDTNNYGILYNTEPSGLTVASSGGATTIDETPVSFEVTEIADEASINVSISFNQIRIQNDTLSLSYTDSDLGITCEATNYYYHAASSGYATLEWDVSISEDLVKDLTNVSITASMKSKGNLSTRKARIDAWFESIDPAKFLYVLAKREYEASHNDDYLVANAPDDGNHAGDNFQPWPLTPWQNSLTIERDKGEIRMTAEFDNRDAYYTNPADIKGFPGGELGDAFPFLSLTPLFQWKNFTFDISQKCSIPVMSIKAGMNGSAFFQDYLIFDHNTLTKETTTFTTKGEVEEFHYGRYNYGNGGLTVPDVALAVNMRVLQLAVLDNPHRGHLDFRGLESYEGSKNRKGIYRTDGEFGGTISKTISLSQTVSNPFIEQDF